MDKRENAWRENKRNLGLARYVHRDHGYFQAKAFLTPQQTGLTFLLGGLVILGLLIYLVLAMLGKLNT